MGAYLDIAKQVIKQRQADEEPTIGSLADFGSRLPTVPVIRITAHETEDVEGDVEWLRRLRELLNEHPGTNRVILTIRTLDGHKVLAEWKALSSPPLRRRIADLLRERTLSLGLVFSKSSSSCIQCKGTNSGSDAHGRIICFTCRRGNFL